MSVHEKIKLIRQVKGWSQDEVAEKLDMSLNAYGNIERGDCDIKLSRLEQIAELFGVNVADLIRQHENGILNLAYKQNQIHCTINSSPPEYQQLKADLEKQQLINEQKEREIVYLKEINALLKKTEGT